MQWITTHEPVAGSTDYGDSFHRVQILEVRNKVLESEIQGHEDTVVAVARNAQTLIATDHYAAVDIHARCDLLMSQWSDLKEKTAERKRKLRESLALQRFNLDAAEVR